MNRRAQVIWTLVILASLAFQWLVAVLGAGYNALAGATDSAGNPIGFNDPITNEHIRMMFARTPITAVFAEAGWYFSLCMVAHLGGLAMIWLSSRRPNRLAAYFGLQTILFPLGWWPLFWLLPYAVVQSLFQNFDGESIGDGPFNLVWSNVLWWAISLIITLRSLAAADRRRKLKPTLATAY